MTVLIKTPPAFLAITKETLKSKHLRIYGTTLDDSSLDDIYIPSAIDYFEFYTHQALITQTLIQAFDKFPDEKYFYLERCSRPINGVLTTSIASIKYYNQEGILTTVDPNTYSINHYDLPISVNLKPDCNWPTDIDLSRVSAVQVEYTTGYGANEAAVPKAIHHCLAMLVATSFVFREDDLYSAGGTIAKPSKNSVDYLDRFRTGFYEHRSQGRGN